MISTTVVNKSGKICEAEGEEKSSHVVGHQVAGPLLASSEEDWQLCLAEVQPEEIKH